MRRTSWLGILLITAFPVLVWGQTGSNLEIGFAGGTINFETDNTASQMGLSYNLYLHKWFSNHFYAGLCGGFAKQSFGAAEQKFSTDFLRGGLFAGYELLPFSRVTPYVQVGAGALSFSVADGPSYWDGDASAGGGLALRLSNALRFSINGAYHFTSGDDFEGAVNNTPDRYVSAHAGLSWAFAQRSTVENELIYSPSENASATVESDSQQDPTSLIEANLHKNMTMRIQELEKQMQAFQEMKDLLRKEIIERDDEIRKLETLLVSRGN